MARADRGRLKNVEMVEGRWRLPPRSVMLLDRGADPNIPDARHGSTIHALAWVRRQAPGIGMGSSPMCPRIKIGATLSPNGDRPARCSDPTIGASPRIAARGLVLAAAVLAHLVVPARLAGRSLADDHVAPAYVRVEPGQVRLLVRIPLDRLGEVGLVASRRAIQVDASAPAIARALVAIDAWFMLAEGGARLASTSARARLSLPSDQSFDGFDRARAHVEQAPAPSEAVYLGQGFLDASLIFRTTSSTPNLRMRLYPSALIPSAVRTAVQYLPMHGAERSFVAAGGAGWIALAPSVTDVTWWFLRSGLQHVSTNAPHLLLLCCLMLRAGTIVRAWPMAAMLSLGRSAAVIGTAFSLAQLGSWVVPPVEAAANASLVGVMLAGLVGLELQRRYGVVALLGLLHGLVFSFALRDQLPLAASHRLMAAIAFNVGLEAGQLGVAAASIALSARATRGRQVTPVAIIAVTALGAHLVWHMAIDQGATRWTSGVGGADRASALILARWVAGVTVAVAASRWLARRWHGLRKPRNQAGAAQTDN